MSENTPNLTPASAGRTSRPEGWNPYKGGGVQVIPRRWDIRSGIATPAVADADQLRASCHSNPLRVLALLPDIDPLAAKSQANTLSLTCAPGDVQIVADKASAAGAGDETVDAAWTAKLDGLWESLPPEVGGLKGIRKSLTKSLKTTGMAIIECVPGPTGTGLAEIWPVDPLTCTFKRDESTLRAELWQHQSIGDVKLDPDFVFYVAADQTVDDPYGRAKDAAALPTILRKMALDQDVQDSVHNSAWKRLVYKYSLKQLWEIATDVLKLPESRQSVDESTGALLFDLQGNPLTEYPAAKWVQDQVDRISSYLGSLKPDDNLSADGGDGGGVDTIDGANLAGIEPVLKHLVTQAIQAYGDAPTMMGVDGPSFNFGSVAWSVQAQLLEDLRDDVLSLPVRAASLHLKLCGSTLTARAEVKPIRVTDALVDAQTKQYEQNNVFALLAWGFITAEQASMKLTGSGIPPEMADLVAARIEAMSASLAAPPQQQASGGDPTKPALPAGSTAEEKGAVQKSS